MKIFKYIMNVPFLLFATAIIFAIYFFEIFLFNDFELMWQDFRYIVSELWCIDDKHKSN